jgi:hypothetical protein
MKEITSHQPVLKIVMCVVEVQKCFELVTDLHPVLLICGIRAMEQWMAVLRDMCSDHSDFP